MQILLEVAKLINQKSNFLPNTKRKLDTEDFLNSKLIKLDKELSADFSSKLKNIELEVYVVNSKELNAGTIPGITNFDNFLANPNKESFNGIIGLHKRPLDFKFEDNYLVANRKLKVIAFINTSLMSRLNNRQIFAVMLHEIGHWVDINNHFIFKLMSKFVTLFGLLRPVLSIDIPNLVFAYNNISHPFAPYMRMLSVGLLFLINLRSRNTEYFCDEFAKKAGYGKDLYDALSLMRFKKVLNNDQLNDLSVNFGSYFQYIKAMAFSYFTGKPPTHPTTISRLKNLAVVDESFSFIDFMFQIDLFISKLILKVCPWIRI